MTMNMLINIMIEQQRTHLKALIGLQTKLTSTQDVVEFVATHQAFMIALRDSLNNLISLSQELMDGLVKKGEGKEESIGKTK